MSIQVLYYVHSYVCGFAVCIVMEEKTNKSCKVTNIMVKVLPKTREYLYILQFKRVYKYI